MIFGCDPESGVQADTNLVEVFVNHLYQNFNAKTGSVKIPQILDLVECEKAQFESTSSNEGKQLELFRQDTRIGVKFLIIITNEQNMTQSMKIARQTFIKSLCFEEKEILHMTLAEAYQLQNLFQFAEPQQLCTETSTKLKAFAEAIFSNHQKHSNQLLQIFLLEANQNMNEDAQFGNLLNFIFQRNPELALFVYQKKADVTKYFKKIEEKIHSKQLISFDNFNTFFYIQEGVVEQIGQADFKPYSGPFRYQLDTGTQKLSMDQTIARQFDVLQILPLRIYNTGGRSFAFPVNDTESIVISLKPQICLQEAQANLFNRNSSQDIGKSSFEKIDFPIQEFRQLYLLLGLDEQQKSQSSLSMLAKSLKLALTGYGFLVQRVQFFHPYSVRDEAIYPVEKPQRFAETQPISIILHNQDTRQIFFSINYKYAVDRIEIFSLKYGEDQILLKKCSIKLDQKCLINLKACEAEKFGIYIYVFSKADTNPQTPSCISVYFIQDDRDPQIKHEKSSFYSFLIKHDKNFVSQIIQIKSNLFNSIDLDHLISQTSDPFRIVYASHNMKFIFDLKMGNGKLVSYPERDINEGKAIGIATLPKIFSIDMYTSELMWLIVEKNLRTQICFNVQMENLRSGQTALDHLQFRDLSPEDRKFIKVLPIRENGEDHRLPEFCFVFRKQTASILQVASLKEFKIIRLNQCHAQDCLTDSFITGVIPNVTLHYFEQIHDNQGLIKYRTYNVFPMFEDFWHAIKAFDGVPPLSKKNFTDKFRDKVKENQNAQLVKRRQTFCFKQQPQQIQIESQIRFNEVPPIDKIEITRDQQKTNNQDFFEIRLKVLEEKHQEMEQKLKKQKMLIASQAKELQKVTKQLLKNQKASNNSSKRIGTQIQSSSDDSSSLSIPSSSESDQTQSASCSKLCQEKYNEDSQKLSTYGSRQSLSQQFGRLNQLKYIFSQDDKPKQQITEKQPVHSQCINLANLKEEISKNLNEMFDSYPAQISKDFYRKSEVDEKIQTLQNQIEIQIMDQRKPAENYLQMYQNTPIKQKSGNMIRQIDESSFFNQQSNQRRKQYLMNKSSFETMRFDSQQSKKGPVFDLDLLPNLRKQFSTPQESANRRQLLVQEEKTEFQPILSFQTHNFNASKQLLLGRSFNLAYYKQSVRESLRRPASLKRGLSYKQAPSAKSNVSTPSSCMNTRPNF